MQRAKVRDARTRSLKLVEVVLVVEAEGIVESDSDSATLGRVNRSCSNAIIGSLSVLDLDRELEQRIDVDAFLKLVKAGGDELVDFFAKLETLVANAGCDMIISFSEDAENVPESIRKYQI